MVHANAPLTPEGRRRLALLITRDGWSVRRAAERFQVSPATASRWAARYRAGLPLTDRSSRPRTMPTRLPRRTERRIVALRFTRQWGPHRIGYHLGIPRSTDNVRTHGAGTKRFRHPVVGELVLAYEELAITAEPGNVLLIYTAEPGSPSGERLKLLASWGADHRSGVNTTMVGPDAG